MARQSRRRFVQGTLTVAGLGLLAGCQFPRLPWQAAKVHRIAFLGTMLVAERLQVFKDGLRELGYLEGQRYTWEPREEGRPERYPELAADVAASRPAMALATDPVSVRALRAADGHLPIVMVGASEIPVELGLIESFARPGGSVTGLAYGHPQLATKRLQLLREVVPGLARVAVLGDANVVPWEANPKYPLFRDAASSLGLELRVVNVRAIDDFAGAFETMAAAGVQGYYADPSPLVNQFHGLLAEQALRHRLPGIFGSMTSVEAGLLTYGANAADVWRRAPSFVDKLIRGAKPADIPVEVPTTFDFVVNLRMAQALGLIIPQSVLQQATELLQ
jgi:putative tryptophan/tyrosine transport system substrate-binding protein